MSSKLSEELPKLEKAKWKTERVRLDFPPMVRVSRIGEVTWRRDEQKARIKKKAREHKVCGRGIPEVKKKTSPHKESQGDPQRVRRRRPDLKVREKDAGRRTERNGNRDRQRVKEKRKSARGWEETPCRCGTRAVERSARTG